MDIVWVLYWILLLISFIVAVMAIKNKLRKTGIIHLLLIPLVVVLEFLFFTSTAWSGTGINEIVFLYNYVLRGNIMAITCVLGYLIIIVLTLYHLIKLKK